MMLNFDPPAEDLGDFLTTPTQWAADTMVDFANVPWDAQYRNIVEFESQSALNSYLDQRATGGHRIQHMTLVRPGEPFRVNLPHSSVQNYNYVRVHNPGGHVTGDVPRNYYYFILDARYIAPNTTQLIVQLDVWATYQWRYTPGWGYLERGHAGIANTHRMTNQGRKYLTVPEGLDTGGEYAVMHTARQKITDRDDYNIIVWSTVMLVDNPESSQYVGTVDDPKLVTARGSSLEGVPNGAMVYIFKTRQDFTSWLADFQDKPWVTQGIISVQAIPNAERYFTNPMSFDGRMGQLQGRSQTKEVSLLDDFRDVARSKLPQKYRHLDKFLTFPYLAIEVTTNTGAPIILKPEMWRSEDAEVREIPYFAQPSPRVMIVPRWYNMGYEANVADSGDGGEHLDIATGIFDFPTFSVVNNGYMSFMASNRHSINFQNQSAEWSQQRSLRAADTSYDQASMGIDASNQQTANQLLTNSQMVGTQNQFGGLRAGASGLTSLGMGAMAGPAGLAGGALSAATSGMNEGINAAERVAMMGVQSGSIQRSSDISSQHAAGVRDSNLDLAQWAAKGDYANAVGAINARVQDAKLTQPTTSGQIGGEAFNLSKDQWGYDLKLKMVHEGAQRMIGDYWLKYGYAIHEMIRPMTLQVMERFSYWKFQEYTITSADMPESYQHAIRGIFEKGVTVWGNPDHIGTTPITNNPPVEGNYFT